MNLRILSRLSIAILVALMALGTVASLHIQTAHAASTPTIVQSATSSNMNNTTGVMSVTLPTAIGPGHSLVILMGWGGGNNWLISSMTDSLGGMFYRSTYTETYIDPADSVIWPLGRNGDNTYGVADGLNDRVSIEMDVLGDAASSGTDTITIDLAEQGCPCGSTWLQTTITAMEYNDHSGENGRLPSGFEWATENGTGGTTHVTDNPTAFASQNFSLGTANSDLDLAIYVDGGANKTITVPTGETMYTNDTPTTNIGFAVAEGSTVNPFEFDTSGTAGYAAMMAISLAGD